MGQEVPRDALPRVGGRGAEAPGARMKELSLRVAVVEGDDEPALDDVADAGVHRLPLQRDVGELAFGELDAARREVIVVRACCLALDPVERSIALGDPKFMKTF